MNTLKISQKTVLSEFHKNSCLELRQLAAYHNTDAANDSLCQALNALERDGKIIRLSGKGRRKLYVLATFES
ncbi:MAG: hypothetical protein H6R18_2159 [Proteobacteria bacterium]|nr:hypothetical protein [Pseudomonadota bacterium]